MLHCERKWWVTSHHLGCSTTEDTSVQNCVRKTTCAKRLEVIHTLIFLGKVVEKQVKPLIQISFLCVGSKISYNALSSIEVTVQNVTHSN